jgi:osmotically-inducible protein OsmY
MADNQRNNGRGRSWNENDPQTNSNQEQNWNSGYNSRYHQDNGNNSNQWNREGDNYRSNSGRYNRDYSSDNSSENENYGYGGREYGSNYGGGNYQGNSSYYNSGGYSSSNRPSYGNSRNLYDRDYEGYSNQSGNSNYSRMGGANYGSMNEDRGRRSYEEGRDYGNNSNYGRMDRNRDFGMGDSNERSWWDRTKDEVSTWFGDDNAERRRERDRQQNHKGKGPKNYNRSDERIKEDINDRLSDDPWVDASDIEVTVNNGEVTLMGTVNERSAKRRAEDLAEAVSGVKNVENRLRVGQSVSDSKIGMGTSIGSGGTGASYSQSTPAGTGSATGNIDREPQGRDTEKSKTKSGYITG